MKIAVLGPGNVGRALGALAAEKGHDVVLGVRDPASDSAKAAAGDRSGAERLAAANAHVAIAKAFNVYGVENLGDPDFGSARGMLPVAGDDDDAKRRVLDLAASFGWEPLDVGPLSMALHLEHMALLWIHMVRAQGHDPRFVWTKTTAG